MIIIVTVKHSDPVQIGRATQWLGTQQNLNDISQYFRPMSYVAVRDATGCMNYSIHNTDGSKPIGKGDWIVKLDNINEIYSYSKVELLERFNIDINNVLELARKEFNDLIRTTKEEVNEYPTVGAYVSALTSNVNRKFL